MCKRRMMGEEMRWRSSRLKTRGQRQRRLGESRDCRNVVKEERLKRRAGGRAIYAPLSAGPVRVRGS